MVLRFFLGSAGSEQRPPGYHQRVIIAKLDLKKEPKCALNLANVRLQFG